MDHPTDDEGFRTDPLTDDEGNPDDVLELSDEETHWGSGEPDLVMVAKDETVLHVFYIPGWTWVHNTDPGYGPDRWRYEGKVRGQAVLAHFELGMDD